MATTTNYSWTTPDDTALVKDGAAAIRTLGSSVDTTTKALNPSTTLGDIEYRSSTANTNTRLGIGTTGQILAVSGGVPAWTTPAAAGGMTLISETTASALSSLSFTSLGSYKQLLLVWNGITHSGTGSAFSIRFNASSATNYYGGGFAGQASDVISEGIQNSSIAANGPSSSTVYSFGQNASSTFDPYTVSGSLLLDNYTSSTAKKFFQAKSFYQNVTDGLRYAHDIVGWFNDTTAITSLDITRLSGSATFSNFSGTTIRLYGVS
jgi:hypothetical protein